MPGDAPLLIHSKAHDTVNKPWRWIRICMAVSAGVALVLAVAAGVLFALLYGAVAPEARTLRPVVVTPTHIEHAVRLLMQHDPRRLHSGAQGTAMLEHADIDTALNYAGQRLAGTHAEWTVEQDRAWLRTSTRLPATPRGNALNVEIELRQDGPLPRIEAVRIGQFAVPAVLVRLGARLALHQLRGSSPGAATALDSIDQVRLAAGGLAIDYTWRRAPSTGGGMRIWSVAEQARIDEYLAVLGRVAQTLPAGSADNPAGVPAGRAAGRRAAMPAGSPPDAPLGSLIAPLLQAAAQRSASDGDAPAENRSALIALAIFVNAEEAAAAGLSGADPAASSASPAAAPDGTGPVARRGYSLNGRADTAQHFTVSAAMSAIAGAPLSDAVGLYKELADAEGGSGFSFNDLAADRAGTRFGEWATSTSAGARKLQGRFAAGQPGWALLPPVADLPEGLQRAALDRRFGGVDGRAARAIRADAERRLAELPLYR
jgi:hypothetical protein